MELKTNKEKMEMIKKWESFIGEGKNVTGIRNKNLKLKIKTKNFLVAYSIIFSSSAALLALGMFGLMGGSVLTLLICILLEIPFALIGYFVNKKSYKIFAAFPDGTFKINGETYFSPTDYLKVYIAVVREDNMDRYVNIAMEASGNVNYQMEPNEYYHVILKTANESTKIGFASENANAIFNLLGNFIYEGQNG